MNKMNQEAKRRTLRDNGWFQKVRPVLGTWQGRKPTMLMLRSAEKDVWHLIRRRIGQQGKGREIYSIDMQLTARREEVRVQLQNDSCGGSLRKAAAAQAAPQAAPQYPQQHARINRPWDVQQMNSVSQIDKISRVVFPLLFLVINLFYWCTYIVEDP